mgnify:CR=1 FL=1
MRKRTISYVAETWFWNIVYFIPIFAYLIILFKTGNAFEFGTIFESIGLNIAENSIAFTSLSQIFGVDGILPLFTNTDLLVFFAYYINVFIAHIFVDFILFIPKIAKKWMNKFTQGDE